MRSWKKISKKEGERERERARERWVAKISEYLVRGYCKEIIYAKAIFSYSHKNDVGVFLSWIIIVLLY